MESRQRQRRSDSGQALIEAAFVLPLLLLVMMGIAQVGILFNNWVMLTEAVRQGGRELAIARAPAPHPDACVKSTNRINAAAIGLTTANVTKSYAFATGSSCTNMGAGTDATVTVTYPCDLSILGVNYAPGCTLRSWSTVRIE